MDYCVWKVDQGRLLALRANGEALVEIARSYAISHSTICDLAAQRISVFK
jgi:hypothetical protein